MGNVRREMELLRKNPKEMLEINTVTEIKNAFDGIISGLDLTEERISELEDIAIETSNRKLKSKEKKD